MQGFSHEDVQLIHRPDGYALLRYDLIYTCELGQDHIAHLGMPTDGISIPPRLTGIARISHFRSPYLRIALIHDHYCYQALRLPPGEQRDALRLKGDRLFYQGSKFLVPEKPNKAWVMYRCVRIGAWSSRKEEAWPSYITNYDAFMRKLLTLAP